MFPTCHRVKIHYYMCVCVCVLLYKFVCDFITVKNGTVYYMKLNYLPLSNDLTPASKSLYPDLASFNQRRECARLRIMKDGERSEHTNNPSVSSFVPKSTHTMLFLPRNDRKSITGN